MRVASPSMTGPAAAPDTPLRTRCRLSRSRLRMLERNNTSNASPAMGMAPHGHEFAAGELEHVLGVLRDERHFPRTQQRRP